MSTIGGIEAGFAIGCRRHVSLQTSRVATAQIPIEMLPENPADTIQSNGIYARIQKTEKTSEGAFEIVVAYRHYFSYDYFLFIFILPLKSFRKKREIQLVIIIDIFLQGIVIVKA